MFDSMSSEQDLSMPIAIVGMAGRFPGEATTPAKLWDMVSNGRHAHSEIPKDRFNIDAFYHPSAEHQGTMYNRGGHFLKDDVAVFDTPFFSITAKEAHSMDPQQRIALELSYECLENAGISINEISGSKMACYMANFTWDYREMRIRDPEDFSLYESTGSGNSLISNRVSWFLDIKGPSVSLDTACSSSLVALHLACQSLRSGEATSALVGGTNVILTPDMSISMSQLHFFSRDSKCKSFDHKADGYARGEGAAVVMVKPLADALRDGNVIRAVIRGTGVNQDGRTPGITVPSSQAQEELIKSTYASAGLDFRDTRYMEAHGTGTPVGDLIECQAIAATLGKSRPEGEPLFIGSVKTNIGHLGGAAGLAGIIKAVYALENGQIPPNLWFEKPNPRILMDEWKLKVPTELQPWPTNGLRRASVNSFGYGGTNAHAILDDAFHYLDARDLSGAHNTVTHIQRVNGAHDGGLSSLSPDFIISDSPTSDDDDDLTGYNTPSSTDSPGEPNLIPRLLVWSSQEQNGFDRTATNVASYIESVYRPTANEGDFLDRLALTLFKRSKFLWKSFAVVSSIQEAIEVLKTPLKPVRANDTLMPAFVFTGQGAQWYAMGRELLAHPVFRSSIDDAAFYFKECLGSKWDLVDELLASEDSSRINDHELSQPACTALQVALVDLLRYWRVWPAVVVGHSSGEIAAAYAKRAISRGAAWQIAYHRGLLSKRITKDGAMLAVGLGVDEVRAFIGQVTKGDVVVACINSPSSVTLSGDTSAIFQVQALLETEKVFNRRLAVKTAYHSPHMKEIAASYLGSLGELSNQDLPDDIDVRMFSSVTGELIETAALVQPSYWVTNLVSPVKFQQAMEAALNCRPTQGRTTENAGIPNLIVEVGPHSALQGPLRQIITSQANEKLDIPCVSLLSRKVNATRTVLEAMGFLFQHGCAVDIAQVNETLGPKGTTLAPLVDLPPYSWNHGTRYWYESPLSRAYRFRETPRHDILGALSEHSTGSEPSWRNYLRVSEIPWLEHHKVQSSILYPFAGMVAMAVEAVRQVADETKEIEGFQLRDISVGAAMIIPPDEPLESKLQLRPWRTGSRLPDWSWYEFNISCRTRQGIWTRHCFGLISVKYKTHENPIFAEERPANAKQYRDEYQRLASTSLDPVDPAHMYAIFSKLGLQFGACFKTVVEMASGDYETQFVVEVPDTKAVMPEKFEHDHIIHPATLDGIIHAIMTAYTPRGLLVDRAMVPRFVESMYVSTRVADKKPGERFYGYSQTTIRGSQGAFGTIVASDSTWEEPLVLVEGFQAASIENVTDSIDSGSANVDSVRQLGSCHRWGVDIDALSSEALYSFLVPFAQDSPDVDPRVVYELELASFIICKRVLRIFTPQDAESFPQHQSVFYKYIQHQYELASFGKLPCQPPLGSDDDWLVTDDAFDTAILERVAYTSSDGKMLNRVAMAMDRILTGELEPLQILSEDDMLAHYYRTAIGENKIHKLMAEYIKQLSHKKPLRILEVGAGTGGTTKEVLPALGRRVEAASRLQLYTYTDISSGFFEAAAENFKEWEDFTEFKVFNAENDPAEQGLEVGVYDVVIANNCLHACSSINGALAQCRKMLKPGGILLIGEMTTQLARVPMIFGTLPGWWLGENDNRQWGPIISEQEWNSRLQAEGFDGICASFRDHSREDAHRLSLMISVAGSLPELPLPERVVIIKPSVDDSLVDSIVHTLSQKLVNERCEVEQVRLSDLHKAELFGKACIVAVEARVPLLYEIEHEDFEAVKRMILKSANTLWLTSGATIACSNPELNLVVGLARTIRSENPGVQLATLDLDPSQLMDAELTCSMITQILRSKADTTNNEWEFAVRKGMIHVPRLYPDQTLSGVFETSNQDPPPDMLQFSQPGRALKLQVKVPGMLDTLQFVECELYPHPLGDSEVEVKVKAVGLNFRDVMTAMGQIQSSFLGVECSGVVSRVGKSVTRWAPGDRVVTLGQNMFRTYIRNTDEMIQRVPDSMSFEDAAALLTIYATTYYSLFDVARLRKGDTLLIHSAAGGLGQAAIILAQHIGAEIFVTVSSESKKSLMIEEYGIREDHIFNSRDHSFVLGIKRMTNERGVDVILNSLAGEALRQTWFCLAPFGRFVELGMRDIDGNSGLDMAPFRRNMTFSSVNLLAIYEDNATLLGRVLNDVMRFYAKGIIKPVKPVKVMNFSQIEEAFRIMQTGKHIGKMVLVANDDDVVPIVPLKKPPISLSPDATYMIPGGLGGLGRAFALWMASKGARHLIFTSRSGARKPAAKAVLESLTKKGVNHKVFTCDISRVADFKRVLEDIRVAGFPPIRGVVTFAMQLQDALFENMTVDEFHAALRPKAQLTRNLHDFLPKDLDFFICMSSVGGIVGSRGQSNYNAGNTFQDAMARHRHALGLKATSIDLGRVMDIGYAAENDDSVDPTIANSGAYAGLKEEDVLGVIEASISNMLSSAENTVGLSTGGMLKHGGYEEPYWFGDRRFGPTQLYGTQTVGRGRSGADTVSLEEGLQIGLAAAKTLDEAAAVVSRALVHKLAKAMMVDEVNIDVGRPANAYGVDSLVAVEIRASVFKQVKSDVSVFDILSNAPLATLARTIAGKSALVSAEVRGMISEDS